MNRFMHKAFSTAKRVRTETRIAQAAVSVSFAAVELARKIFGELGGKTVLVVGAGEMCELAATHLVENGVSNVVVTNRTFERAQSLAMRWLADFSRKRPGKSMKEKLANEIIDAANERGESVKKREDTHRMADANKAFSHYRW